MLPIGDENPHPPGFKPKLTYALIAGGIVASSLFFVKSVNDKRRIDKMLSN